MVTAALPVPPHSVMPFAAGILNVVTVPRVTVTGRMARMVPEHAEALSYRVTEVVAPSVVARTATSRPALPLMTLGPAEAPATAVVAEPPVVTHIGPAAYESLRTRSKAVPFQAAIGLKVMTLFTRAKASVGPPTVEHASAVGSHIPTASRPTPEPVIACVVLSRSQFAPL